MPIAIAVVKSSKSPSLDVFRCLVTRRGCGRRTRTATTGGVSQSHVAMRRRARENSYSSTCRSELVGPDFTFVRTVRSIGSSRAVCSVIGKQDKTSNEFVIVPSVSHPLYKTVWKTGGRHIGRREYHILCGVLRTLFVQRQLRICQRHRFSKMFLVGNLWQSACPQLQRLIPRISRSRLERSWVQAGSSGSHLMSLLQHLFSVRKETRHHHNRLG